MKKLSALNPLAIIILAFEKIDTRIRIINLSSLKSHLSFPKGFTLIELLVVIAILGIIAVGLIAAIDPADKINASGDARIRSDVGVMARAIESYSATQGYYPAALSDLTTSATQELKAVPVPPANQCGATTVLNVYDGGTSCDLTASSVVNPPGAQTSCTTAAKDCKSVIITAALKSKKYTSAGTPVWRYESATGKSCAVALISTVCP